MIVVVPKVGETAGVNNRETTVIDRQDYRICSRWQVVCPL